MSFLGGPECSTAGNPLTQFSKHVQDDKSLQRDRLVGRGPGGLPQGLRTQGMMGGQDQMMDDFIQQSGQIPQGVASPFAMDQMRREIENYSHSPLRSGSPANNWAAEFQPGLDDQARMQAAFQQSQRRGFSPAEFARFQQRTPERVASPAPQASNAAMQGFQRPLGMNYGMNMGLGGMGMGMMNRPYSGLATPHVGEADAQTKGKGRMVELDDHDWEAHFAQLDAEGQQRELDAKANAAMEAELSDLDRSVQTETNEFGDFEGIWRSIQAEKAANRHMADNQDFATIANEPTVDDLDDWGGFDHPINTHPVGYRDPQLGEYMFEDDNLFDDIADPYTEGVRIMEGGGNLSLAALAFESAVRKDPMHVQAWTMLGSAQAQNEKETPAIRALEQALRVDPNNLEALMNLAVSYTNEGYDATAYRTLERWLATKYPQVIDKANLSPDADVGFTDRHKLHEKVTDLYIQAAQLSPSGEQMDPDVQVGLGVLFYGAEEYEKAVDCFTAALTSTEAGLSNKQGQVHLLWNRLGATLANSGRSEEAIAAYEKALTLNPNFVRARYNLGVSCINIGCYAEAAQHLLGALSMHKIIEQESRERAIEFARAGGRPVDESSLDHIIAQNQSTNLYDTLRRVFTQMGRRDLSDRVVPGMDVDVFRSEFEF